MLTALFINTRTLKFKNQLTFAFFAAVNQLDGPLRKHRFKRSRFVICDWWIFGLCVSVFQGSLLVIVIIIDGSEKRNCEGGF